jgi:hypothetical protein
VIGLRVFHQHYVRDSIWSADEMGEGRGRFRITFQ